MSGKSLYRTRRNKRKPTGERTGKKKAREGTRTKENWRRDATRRDGEGRRNRGKIYIRKYDNLYEDGRMEGKGREREMKKKLIIECWRDVRGSFLKS